jgi:hypothetical protein
MQPELFVIAPFDSQFQPVREAVHQAALEAGFSVGPSNPYSSGSLRTSFILERIRMADVIVADISGQNVDVMYEIGFADAFHKPTILLLNPNVSKTGIPNDLFGFVYIFYDLEDLGKLKTEVQAWMERMALRRSA